MKDLQNHIYSLIHFYATEFHRELDALTSFENADPEANEKMKKILSDHLKIIESKSIDEVPALLDVL
jgi:uncharacterized damage-inducible protein DinB